MDKVQPGDKVMFDGNRAEILAPFVAHFGGGPYEQQLCCDPDHEGWLWVIRYLDNGKQQAGVCQDVMEAVEE